MPIRMCRFVLLAAIVWPAALMMAGCDRSSGDPERDAVTAAAPSSDEAPSDPAPKPSDPSEESEPPEKKELTVADMLRKQRVPPGVLDGGTAWINTEGPLELESLRGKFVLLDFWTYCCINCMHVLPELKKIEHAYPNEVVVIGVHSAKFDEEKDAENIREAVLRYEIEHPVVNDSEHRIWNRFGVRSWPTLLLIDPEGNLLFDPSGRTLPGPGESTFEQVDALLKALLPSYREKGLVDERPVQFDLEASRAAKTPLRFPGKVLADEAGGRLLVADSNHNRIVVTDLDGRLLEVIGSGAIGRADGDYATASFNHLQGMALRGKTLYVADTENHLLRKIDLEKKQVATIAGIGEQGRGGWPRMEQLRAAPPNAATDLPERWVGPPKTTALNSPWALWIHGDDLYIAMAGPHQIWKMPLDESEIGPYAGNGREDIVDGPLLPKMPYQEGFSSFAQPSGLASDGEWLYVADSEGSSIRVVPFDAGEQVRTLVGTSELPAGRLFVFGDRDGRGKLELTEQRLLFRGRADQTEGPLLQHALGVVFYEGKLYVADTYNNKIKVIDVETADCKTLAGSGEPGAGDEPAQFDEPAGITTAAGKLYVADTNNHLIRVVDLENGGKVTTLRIEGLEPPKR